jgi:general secretion pathway protein B
MSFILDALKKSESDRQRRSGPALFEVKLAPPRTGLPLWAIALAALFAVNIGIVGWMVLRHPATRAPEAAAPAAVAPAAGTQPAAGAALPAQAAPAATAPPPQTAPAASAAAPATAAPGLAPSAAHTAGGADEPSPEDYAPATEPAGSLGKHVRRGTDSGVPLYQEAATGPGARIPQLRLDLHVYAVRPQDRFVMINMHKLREGESLPEGVHVESITPEGAVLSYNGSRFLLTRE